MEKKRTMLCAAKTLKPFENKFQPMEWVAIKKCVALAITKGYREGRTDERKRIHASKI